MWLFSSLSHKWMRETKSWEAGKGLFSHYSLHLLQEVSAPSRSIQGWLGWAGWGWSRCGLSPFTSLSSPSLFHNPFYQLDSYFYCKMSPFQQLSAPLGAAQLLFLPQGRLCSTGIQWLFPSLYSVLKNKDVPEVVSPIIKSSEEIACVLGWWSNAKDLTLFSVSKNPVTWNRNLFNLSTFCSEFRIEAITEVGA